MKARRPLRPALESLDSRCLPSGLGIHPAAEVSVLAKSKVLNLNGSLTGTVSLPAATSGVQFVTVLATGKLGKTTFALNVTARVELLVTPGSTLSAAFGATQGKQHAVLNIQLSVPQQGTPLTYKITGGTGFLKGSTGTGTVTYTLPQGPPPGGPRGAPVVLTFHASGH